MATSHTWLLDSTINDNITGLDYALECGCEPKLFVEVTEMRTTKIEWTERTWNPVTGCNKVSEGCRHCYAETMTRRLFAMGNPKYANNSKPTEHPEDLLEPYSWRKQSTVFVCSMSDLFNEKISFNFIDKVFDVIKDTPWIIVGGESGVSARPMNEKWILNIREQARLHNIPFFFKQWGTWGQDGTKRNKKANGKLLQGNIIQQMPEI